MSFPLRLQSLTSKQCFMVKIPLDLVTDQRVSELNKSSHKEEQQWGLAFFGFGFNFSPSPSHNIPSYDCPLPLLAPMLFHASLWPTLAAPPTPSSIPSSRAPRTQVLAPRPVWVSWLVLLAGQPLRASWVHAVTQSCCSPQWLPHVKEKPAYKEITSWLQLTWANLM